jgi:hypothetical protein
MNKKIILAGIAVFAVALGMATMAPAMASNHKIEVCHFDDEFDTYTTIEVGSQSSADKHLANHQYDDGDDYLGACI